MTKNIRIEIIKRRPDADQLIRFWIDNQGFTLEPMPNLPDEDNDVHSRFTARMLSIALHRLAGYADDVAREIATRDFPP